MAWFLLIRNMIVDPRYRNIQNNNFRVHLWAIKLNDQQLSVSTNSIASWFHGTIEKKAIISKCDIVKWIESSIISANYSLKILKKVIILLLR